MIGLNNAHALTASALASWSADELRAAGFGGNDEKVRDAAGDCVAPLLRAALIALELSGLLDQEQSAGVHDVISDYINVPAPRPGADDQPRLNS